MEKRTKDLTAAEIDSFSMEELAEWVPRVMNRLSQLIKPESYQSIAQCFIELCAGGIKLAKIGLKEMVNAIKANWIEPPLPPLPILR